MELPRKILIGNDVIYQLGSFIRDLNDKTSIVAVISGNTVKARVGKELCGSSGQLIFEA